MQHGTDMGVVGVDATGINRVEESRANRIAALLIEQDRCIAAAAERGHVVARPAAPGHARADGADAQEIEKELAERDLDVGGKLVAAQIGGEGRKRRRRRKRRHCRLRARGGHGFRARFRSAC